MHSVFSSYQICSSIMCWPHSIFANDGLIGMCLPSDGVCIPWVSLKIKWKRLELQWTMKVSDLIWYCPEFVNVIGDGNAMMMMMMMMAVVIILMFQFQIQLIANTRSKNPLHHYTQPIKHSIQAWGMSCEVAIKRKLEKETIGTNKQKKIVWLM